MAFPYYPYNFPLTDWANGRALSNPSITGNVYGIMSTLGATPNNADLTVRARLDRLDSGVIDPLDPTYGAVGDGTTNDTIAIQNAINAAAYVSASANGAIVQVLLKAGKRFAVRIKGDNPVAGISSALYLYDGVELKIEGELFLLPPATNMGGTAYNDYTSAIITNAQPTTDNGDTRIKISGHGTINGNSANQFNTVTRLSTATAVALSSNVLTKTSAFTGMGDHVVKFTSGVNNGKYAVISVATANTATLRTRPGVSFVDDASCSIEIHNVPLAHGIRLSRTKHNIVEDIRIKNILGTSRNDSNDMFAVQTYRGGHTDVRAVSVTSDDGGLSCTGFSSDYSSFINYVDCRAYSLEGNGFTHFNTSYSRQEFCSSYLNNLNGFKSENSAGIVYQDCRAGGISAALHSGTGVYSSSAGIGNALSGFFIDQSLTGGSVELRNCHSVKNTLHGVAFRGYGGIIDSSSASVINTDYGVTTNTPDPFSTLHTGVTGRVLLAAGTWATNSWTATYTDNNTIATSATHGGATGSTFYLDTFGSLAITGGRFTDNSGYGITCTSTGTAAQLQHCGLTTISNNVVFSNNTNGTFGSYTGFNILERISIPAWRKGGYLYAPQMGTVSSSVTLSSSRLYYMAIVIPTPTSIVSFRNAVLTNTHTSGSGTIKWNLYASDATTGRPTGAPLGATDATATLNFGTTGKLEGTLSTPIYVGPGIYWIGTDMTNTLTGGACTFTGGTGFTLNEVGFTSTENDWGLSSDTAWSTVLIQSGVNTASALPSVGTISFSTTNQAPITAVKVG